MLVNLGLVGRIFVNVRTAKFVSPIWQITVTPCVIITKSRNRTRSKCNIWKVESCINWQVTNKIKRKPENSNYDNNNTALLEIETFDQLFFE